MRPDRWCLREMLGVAFAAAVVAVPTGSLARQELAEHWAWAGAAGALWGVIALTWAVVTGIAADAVRRLAADEAQRG